MLKNIVCRPLMTRFADRAASALSRSRMNCLSPRVIVVVAIYDSLIGVWMYWKCSGDLIPPEDTFDDFPRVAKYVKINHHVVVKKIKTTIYRGLPISINQANFLKNRPCF